MSESASTLIRVPRETTPGVWRRIARGRSAAGEGEAVLTLEVFDQIAGPAHEEREAPLGQICVSTRSSKRRWATSAELVAGLVSTGMPASRATAAFSARPQAGKLKAFTWTATPVPRGQDVLADQARGPAELNRLAIDEEAPVAQGDSHFREGLKRGDRAIHVELGVGARVAAVGHGETDQFVAVLLKKSRGLLNQFAALLEGQGAQGGATLGAGEVERLLPIEAVRRGVGEDFFGRRVEKRFACALALLPFTAQIALEFRHGVRVC